MFVYMRTLVYAVNSGKQVALYLTLTWSHLTYYYYVGNGLPVTSNNNLIMAVLLVSRSGHFV